MSVRTLKGGMVRGRDERTCSHINMQHTILRKGCMLGELEGGGVRATYVHFQGQMKEQAVTYMYVHQHAT